MKNLAFLLLLFPAIINAQEPKKEIYLSEILERAINSPDSISINFDSYIIKSSENEDYLYNHLKSLPSTELDSENRVVIPNRVKITESNFLNGLRISNLNFSNGLIIEGCVLNNNGLFLQRSSFKKLNVENSSKIGPLTIRESIFMEESEIIASVTHLWINQCSFNGLFLQFEDIRID